MVISFRFTCLTQHRGKTTRWWRLGLWAVFSVGFGLIFGSFSPLSDCSSLPSTMTWAPCPHGVRTRGKKIGHSTRALFGITEQQPKEGLSGNLRRESRFEVHSVECVWPVWSQTSPVVTMTTWQLGMYGAASLARKSYCGGPANPSTFQRSFRGTKNGCAQHTSWTCLQQKSST